MLQIIVVNFLLTPCTNDCCTRKFIDRKGTRSFADVETAEDAKRNCRRIAHFHQHRQHAYPQLACQNENALSDRTRPLETGKGAEKKLTLQSKTNITMKIWKEFNSSHSTNISIIGTFENVADAKKAYAMIEDFARASWEERYPSIKEFNEHWATNYHADVPYIGIFPEEFESGVDNEPDVELEGDTIKISHFRTNNFGGIIKLMRFTGADKIVVE